MSSPGASRDPRAALRILPHSRTALHHPPPSIKRSLRADKRVRPRPLAYSFFWVSGTAESRAALWMNGANAYVHHGLRALDGGGSGRMSASATLITLMMRMLEKALDRAKAQRRAVRLCARLSCRRAPSVFLRRVFPKASNLAERSMRGN